MKMTVFWVVAPCTLVVYRRFRGAYCLHHTLKKKVNTSASIIALMMEAVNTSETSVYFYQTIRRNNPEDSHLRFTPSLQNV
jgi:hypothetical protein